MDSPDELALTDDVPKPSSTSQIDNDESNTTVGPPRQPRPCRHRGRHAKDPLGQTIFFKVQRVEELESKLREYLANPTGDPEHTTLEFSFPVTAAFMVAAREPLPGANKHGNRVPYMYSAFNKTAISVIDALHTIKDPKEQMLMQKRISKTLVEAVTQADGYRYSFHNHWVSREDQASRFSYYCNDSTLNKGRAANEGVKMVKNNVKVRKEVFDCQGLISVKFSVTKMSLELHYKHVPLHGTYEERAPPPRSGSKRRKLLEIFHPDKLPKPKPKEKKRKSTPPPQNPRKRRRATEPPPQPEIAQGGLAPQSGRESSLQPLFDFLGAAGRSDEEPTSATFETAGGIHIRSTESAPPTNATHEIAAGASNQRNKDKAPPFPGMMTGFMSGEGLNWGRKNDTRTPRRKPSQRNVTATVTTPTGPPVYGMRLPDLQYQGMQAVAFTPDPVDQTGNPNAVQNPSSTPIPNTSSELDALKTRLQEAEQKIRDLEAQKARAATMIAWNPPIQHPPPPGSAPAPVPNAGYPHPPPYYPPPQYPYPPPHWPYPQPPPAQPYPRAPPHPQQGHPGTQAGQQPIAPQGVHSVPAHGPAPPSARTSLPATHPHAHAYAQLSPPPPQPPAQPAHASAPAYRFVPNPPDLISGAVPLGHHQQHSQEQSLQDLQPQPQGLVQGQAPLQKQDRSQQQTQPPTQPQAQSQTGETPAYAQQATTPTPAQTPQSGEDSTRASMQAEEEQAELPSQIPTSQPEQPSQNEGS